MKVRNLAIISIISLMFILSGCELYDYSKIQGGEIPVTVAKEVDNGEEEVEDVDEFKKQLEKLQSIIELEESSELEEEKVEEVVEEVSEEPVIVIDEGDLKLEVVEEELKAEEKEEVVEEEVEKVEEGTFSGVPTITVNEGELVNLNLKSSDPDGDKIVYTFTKPLDDEGKWQTGYDDAGNYKVKITASDGKLTSEQDVLVVVKEVNRAPIISGVSDLTVKEGEIVTLSPKVTDPDGGTITISYSGWMNAESKEVEYDQAGMHTVTVTATDSDGESSKKTITVTVENVNRAPKIISITNS